MEYLCRFVAGAGAVEIELADILDEYAPNVSELSPYAIKTYATSLNIFTENTGLK